MNYQLTHPGHPARGAHPVRRRLAGVLLLVLVLTHVAESAPASAKPNVVFILADDLGWADLGCYGSTFHETPNLDRLAKEGLRFTDAYAACNVCSPTRAAILTGKSPARLQLTDWIPGRPDRPDQKLARPAMQKFLPLAEVTWPEVLREAGYRTAFIGKWHLGEATNHWPEHQGFDLNIGGCGKGHPPSYFSPYGIPNLTNGPPGEYLNERLTSEALRFIEQAPDKPFLLYLSHYAVHTPLQARPEVIQKYREKAARQPAAGPEFVPDHGRPVRQIQNHPVYGAMMAGLDDSVGRVLDKLEALGLATNTIVIFTSDNGGLSTAEGSPTSNLPWRTGKGWAYEGGVRVPLLIRWPGFTQPGSTSHQPASSTDFYPTLLEALGLPLRPQQHVDGASLMAALQGRALPERPLFWHYPHYSNQGGTPHGAVRLGDYKLIQWYEDLSVELFDLKHDPGERQNLATSHAQIATKLTQLLQDWRRQVNASMPTPNPAFRPEKSGALTK
jgi:arylsulfatase A-like enzyme